MSTGLRRLKQVRQTRQSHSFLRRNRFILVRHDHLQLSPADAVMYLRWAVQPSPDNQPEESQRACDHECRPSSPAEVNPQNNEGSDSAPDRRTTVKKGRG